MMLPLFSYAGFFEESLAGVGSTLDQGVHVVTDVATNVKIQISDKIVIPAKALPAQLAGGIQNIKTATISTAHYVSRSLATTPSLAWGKVLALLPSPASPDNPLHPPYFKGEDKEENSKSSPLRVRGARGVTNTPQNSNHERERELHQT